MWGRGGSGFHIITVIACVYLGFGKCCTWVFWLLENGRQWGSLSLLCVKPQLQAAWTLSSLLCGHKQREWWPIHARLLNDTRALAHTCARTRRCSNTRMLTHSSSYLHTHTRSHSLIQAHLHTHLTHTHTQAHTQSIPHLPTRCTLVGFPKEDTQVKVKETCPDTHRQEVREDLMSTSLSLATDL